MVKVYILATVVNMSMKNNIEIYVLVKAGADTVNTVMIYIFASSMTKSKLILKIPLKNFYNNENDNLNLPEISDLSENTSAFRYSCCFKYIFTRFFYNIDNL